MTTSISTLPTVQIAGLTSTQVSVLTTDQQAALSISGIGSLLCYTFSDNTYTTITGIGMSGIWLPLPADDSRVVAYNTAQAILAAVQSAQTQYDAALAAGLIITSTGTPALNATYDVSASAQNALTELEVAVANNLFPGYYRDKSSAKITMTAAQFTSIAAAVMAYVLAWNNALDAVKAGGVLLAPVNTAIIA